MLSQITRLTDGRTDRQTDGQTEFSSLDRVCIPFSAVKIIILILILNKSENSNFDVEFKFFFKTIISILIFNLSKDDVTSHRDEIQGAVGPTF